jgi:hypothetical protein
MKVLDGRRATLSDLINGNAALSRKWRCGSRRRLVEDGNAVELASMARRLRDAPARGRDRHQALPALCPGAALTGAARPSA